MLEEIAARAQSAGGARKLTGLVPTVEAEWIRDRQVLLGETRAICEAGQAAWPLHPTHDLRDVLLEATRIGACLEPAKLQQVAATLHTAAAMKRFLEAHAPLAPQLQAYAAALCACAETAAAITTAVRDTGEVDDAASPHLRDLRRRQVQVRDALLARLEKLLAAAPPEHDSYVTLRADRYVIPVRTELGRGVQGIVHDRSASGATLFVEPLEVVDANNERQALQDAERREVARILRQLTARVGHDAEAIAVTLETLEELDALQAIWTFAVDLRASTVKLEGTLDLREARHPLLELQLATSGKSVVPLQVQLDDTRGLVITGPNTGGKTVALKTIGLLVLLQQAGVPVPAHADSRLPLYKRLIADIGDEQSIAASQSTFSSHLRHVVRAVQEAGPGVLILLDEFMSGTDPEEGAALARVILRQLVDRGATVVVTTHLGALKVFAHAEAGLANAAMLFDAASRSPTFRLQRGVPGNSNAFDVAQRLGLDVQLLEAARQQRGAAADLSDVIAALEGERQRLEEARGRATSEAEETHRIREEHAQALAHLKRSERDLLTAARREAGRLVQDAKAEIERVVRDIRESAASRDSIRAAHQVVQQLQSAAAPTEPPASASAAREAQPGDVVFVRSLQREGRFQRREGDGRARVQVGQVDFVVDISELEWRAPAGETETGSRAGGFSAPETGAVPARLDLRGLERDEALLVLEKFLDQMLLQGAPRAEIIHGKGTGVLRRAVQEFLAGSPYVTSQRLGEHGEGGSGVTIVTLRQ